MRKILGFLLLSLAMTSCSLPSSSSKPVSETVSTTSVPVLNGSYEVSSREERYGSGTGYLARPVNESTVPGLVLVDNSLHMSRVTRLTADRLATHGYRVLAVNLHENKTKKVSDDEDPVQHLAAAIQSLENNGSSRSGIVGIGRGGDHALQLAVSDHAPETVVVFNADPEMSREKLRSFTPSFLGIYASEDDSIKKQRVQALDILLDNTTEHEISVYDAGRGFANPTEDTFDEEAAKAAWRETIRFLNQTLSHN